MKSEMNEYFKVYVDGNEVNEKETRSNFLSFLTIFLKIKHKG